MSYIYGMWTNQDLNLSLMTAVGLFAYVDTHTALLK